MPPGALDPITVPSEVPLLPYEFKIKQVIVWALSDSLGRTRCSHGGGSWFRRNHEEPISPHTWSVLVNNRIFCLNL